MTATIEFIQMLAAVMVVLIGLATFVDWRVPTPVQRMPEF
jgi:hypothetical protein